MIINRAKEIVLNKYPDCTIQAIMEVPNKYIFSIKPNDWDNNETLADPFFSVSKIDGKLSEYSPGLDLEEWGKAVDNIVYSIHGQ